MWRVFQNIPRAVRQQWNSSTRATPQTVCREDDPECCHKGAACADTKDGNSHQIQRYVKPPSTSGSEQEWRERRRSFRQDFWSSIHQPHSPVEAVGWGTALVLGMQLSHGWWREDSKDGNHQHHLVEFLSRLARSMPLDGITRKSIKPSTQPSSPGGNQQQRNFDASHLDPVPESTTTDGAAGNEEALDEAVQSWQSLFTTYAAMARNQKGLTKARRGQVSEAVGLFRTASQAGYAKAHYNMGLCYELGHGVEKDLTKAVEYYSLASEEGHTKALYNLGVMYLQGVGGLEKNTTAAVELLEQAAAQGLKQAQTQLGVLYTMDERKDLQKAALLFSMAAKQKDARAEHYLGICYENGWGVEQNDCQAAEYYGRAGRQGHASAQYSLAVFFEHGRGGLPIDLYTALDLYKKASRDGVGGATKDVDRVQRLLAGEVVEQNEDIQEQAHDLLTFTKRKTYSSSSPTFTDFVRQHLFQFGFTDWENTDMASLVPKLLPKSEISVKFYLGEEPEEEETDIDSVANSDLDSVHSSTVALDTLPGSFGNVKLRPVSCSVAGLGWGQSAPEFNEGLTL